MADKRYVVCAPYVTLRTMTADGVRLMGFYDGAPVPADVPQWQIDHHLSTGQIRELPQPAPAPAPESEPPKAAPQRPAGKAAPAPKDG